MADKDFILVAYDISSDKRRTKLHNALLDFGTPVQYSVFECLLDDKQKEKMKKKVMKVIRPKKDQVRFYTLCAECVKRVEVTSGREVLHDSKEAIIVG
ncbi:MAG: CRISPR-associated endonuclease Cas2 [Chloroflexi bacterium]|nr:CRISPR-associated endonuclease Cas2 [Chloroflexota bacterium]